MDAPSDSVLSSWLDQEIEAASAGMHRGSRGESVCTIQKDGRVTSDMKRLEGRLVALAEVRRLARSRDLIGRDLESIAERWTYQVEMRQSSQPSSRMWVAYATGGLDAIREAISRAPTGP